MTATLFVQAQNIGINNPAPQFPLSFDGNLGDKISLWTDGSPTHYGFGIQSGLLQMFSKTDLDDIAFGYGSSNNFIEAMRIKGNGNVGIATISSTAKLSIGFNGTEITGTAMSNTLKTNAGSLGNNDANEISLASIGYKADANNVALGIRAYRNTAGSGWTGTSLLFEYDVDNTVRAAGGGSGFLALNALGNIGIGMTNPQFPLDINGRMRLSGSNPNDPGIWLNDAGVNRAFIGLQNNNHVGFYGEGGVGWGGLTMNTITGALALNGNEGQAGQLLTSNSSSSGASWTNRPYVAYYNENGSPTLNGNNLCVDIAGINGQSFTLTQDAYITYQLNTALFADNGTFGGASSGAVSIQFLNAVSAVASSATSQFVINNFNSSTIVLTGIGILAAGNYQIRARLARNSTGDGNTVTNFGAIGNVVNCNDIPIVNGQLIIQVFPK